MQTHSTFSNLNALVQSWYLRLVLCRILLLVVIVLASILLLHLASVVLMVEGCHPNCAPLVV